MNQKKTTKNKITPDPVYNNVIVSKFINQIMRKGKKILARKIVYNSFKIIHNKIKKDSLEIFMKAIENASPMLEVKPKRVGGAVYQVPREVPENRKKTLAMRWIIDAAKKKKKKSMEEKLAEELIEASENKGAAIKKREDVQRMAEANKAFAHFAR
jgi:small subunit ribosomal protein S7